MISNEMAASKRHDPNFSQVSGYIEKELFLQFKARCAIAEKTISEVLEELIREWLAEGEQGKK